MPEIRDLGALLQRAGFALPVADNAVLQAEYRDMFHLMHDLRAMEKQTHFGIACGNPRNAAYLRELLRCMRLITRTVRAK